MNFTLFEDYEKTEHYKESVRGAEYVDNVYDKTNETLTINFYNEENNVEYKIETTFTLRFSFTFERGFYKTQFSNIVIKTDYDLSEDEKQEIIKFIEDNFVDEDRLSC